MKHRCKCGRKAVFVYKGKVKADDDHDLCPRCWRDARNASQ